MTGYLCGELNELLKNTKINKIYQTSSNDVFFEIYAPVKGTIHLRACANSNYPHLSLTKLSELNPLTPPAFCMLLRKHLLGGKIKAASQNLHDRIITLKVEQPDEIGDLRTRYLIVELTAKIPI
jgi:predicted ribosome quality control (RQC) complex YloA/Tae2 family protein